MMHVCLNCLRAVPSCRCPEGQRRALDTLEGFAAALGFALYEGGSPGRIALARTALLAAIGAGCHAKAIRRAIESGAGEIAKRAGELLLEGITLPPAGRGSTGRSG